MGAPSAHSPRYAAVLEWRRSDLCALVSQELPARRNLVWEVGCGHGHFLTAYAQNHPDRFCVGIDLDTERIRRANRKRSRAGIENLRFIQSEARLFLEVLPPEVRFSDVYVLFPDPWPKARHHKHRIIQPVFLTLLAARMAAGAHLFFRTDFAPYFLQARETLREHRGWRLSENVWEFEYETVFQQRAKSYASLIARVRPPA